MCHVTGDGTRIQAKRNLAVRKELFYTKIFTNLDQVLIKCFN